MEDNSYKADDVALQFKDLGKLVRSPKSRRVVFSIPGNTSMRRARRIIRDRLRANAQWRKFHQHWIRRLEIEDYNCRVVYKIFTREIQAGRRKTNIEDRTLIQCVCSVDSAHKYSKSVPVGRNRMTVEEKRRWYAAHSTGAVKK